VKKVAVIPTLLTLANGVCGFSALVWASKIDFTESTEWYFALSGWLIIAAMVCDALDGFVARLSRTASKFGGELDSLCDAISFGAAPAFLLLKVGPAKQPQPFLHQLLVGVATLYLVCVLLRLARFNVQNTTDPAGHKRFRGLPSPGAAGCIASLAILRGGLDDKFVFDVGLTRTLIEFGATVGAVCIALLMVSRVSFPHLTHRILRGRRHFTHLIQVILACFVIVMSRQISLVVLFWGYALFFPCRYALVRSLREEPRPGLDEIIRH
jgi:CDP-diacylglycerol--serine O-phosphatidyltransferase